MREIHREKGVGRKRDLTIEDQYDWPQQQKPHPIFIAQEENSTLSHRQAVLGSSHLASSGSSASSSCPELPIAHGEGKDLFATHSGVPLKALLSFYIPTLSRILPISFELFVSVAQNIFWRLVDCPLPECGHRKFNPQTTVLLLGDWGCGPHTKRQGHRLGHAPTAMPAAPPRSCSVSFLGETLLYLSEVDLSHGDRVLKLVCLPGLRFSGNRVIYKQPWMSP